MLDFTSPHLSGDVGEMGKGIGSFGAEATANVLRIVMSDTAKTLTGTATALSDTAKTLVWGTLTIVGAFVFFKIAVGLHREFGGAKPPVEHSVLHRNERTTPPPPASSPAAASAPAL
jgi:hypothetical protein